MDESNPTESWLAAGWNCLDSKHRDVLTRVSKNQTLKAIGRALNISRERVRQIRDNARVALLEVALTDQSRWYDRLTRFMNSKSAVSALELRSVFTSANDHAIHSLLDALGYEHPKTWAGVLHNFWARRRDDLGEQFIDLAKGGPYQETELSLRALALGMPSEIPVISIANHAKSPLALEHGYWVRRQSRRGDAAYLWLIQEGMPCPTYEIAAALGYNERALAEALRRDERFVRLRSERKWGLAEWPEAASLRYGNTLEAALGVLQDHGPIRKQDLIRETIRRYPVTYARVIQCLSSSQIGLVPGTKDTFDLVERGAIAIPEREPQKPDNVQVSDSGNILAFRVPVNSEVIRGSGIVVSRWITWFLGLHNAPMSRSFRCTKPTETLVVARNTSNAQISSLRAHVEEIGLVQGCELAVLLRLDEDAARIHHACRSEGCPAATTHSSSRRDVSERRYRRGSSGR